MGEYEERYPDAYGRGDDNAEPAAPPSPPADRKEAALSQPQDGLALRRQVGLGAAAETRPAWNHRPSEPAGIVEPAPPSARSAALDYRGVGPRGYVRKPERLYEDICDRLMENPFIDASDITVSVTGSEVRLAGSVDSAIVARQAETIARQVSGVSWVRNDLLLHPAGETPQASSRQPIGRVAAADR